MARQSPGLPLRQRQIFQRFESSSLRFGNDQRKRKAIVSFAADGLDCRGAHSRFRRDQFIETADALDGWITAGRINYRSLAHDVVGDDQSTAPREPEGPHK